MVDCRLFIINRLYYKYLNAVLSKIGAKIALIILYYKLYMCFKLFLQKLSKFLGLKELKNIKKYF